MGVASEDGQREPLEEPCCLAWLFPQLARLGSQAADEGESVSAENPRGFHGDGLEEETLRECLIFLAFPRLCVVSGCTRLQG